MYSTKTVKTVTAPAEVFLNACNELRMIHFINQRQNSADTFEVAFYRGELCFASDKVTPEEIREYEKVFRKYSGASYLDSPGQEERYKKVFSRFGNGGADALRDMFKYVHDEARRRSGRRAAGNA